MVLRKVVAELDLHKFAAEVPLLRPLMVLQKAEAGIVAEVPLLRPTGPDLRQSVCAEAPTMATQLASAARIVRVGS